MVKTCLTVK